jgi:hypothetical protein
MSTTYTFQNWTVNGTTSTQNPINLTIISDTTVTAQYMVVNQPMNVKINGWIQSTPSETATIKITNATTAAIVDTITVTVGADGKYETVKNYPVGKYKAVVSIAAGTEYLSDKSATVTFKVNVDNTVSVYAYKQARGITVLISKQ